MWVAREKLQPHPVLAAYRIDTPSSINSSKLPLLLAQPPPPFPHPCSILFPSAAAFRCCFPSFAPHDTRLASGPGVLVRCQPSAFSKHASRCETSPRKKSPSLAPNLRPRKDAIHSISAASGPSPAPSRPLSLALLRKALKSVTARPTAANPATGPHIRYGYQL